MDSLIGSTLGVYQILSEIGRGGMGVVYRGFQPSLNRSVAIKVLAAHLAHDDTLVKRFLHEARFIAGLNHPNIITIYEVSTTPPYYIAMQYIEGETLAQHIHRERVLAPQQAAEIISQIGDALDYAHARSIIHRDIKPSNILLDKQGHAILTDFGIARAVEGTRLTQDERALGTPDYMAPELIEGAQATHSSDIYALGIVLYEMLTGRAPFHAETPLAILHQHLNQAPPPLRTNNPRLAPTYEPVLKKALAKKPEQRYHTAREMADAFRAALQGRAPAFELPRYAIWIVLAILLLAFVLVAFASGWVKFPPTAQVLPTAVPPRTQIVVIVPPTVTPPPNTNVPTPRNVQPTHTLVPTFTPAPSFTPRPPNTALPIALAATETATEIPPPTATRLPEGVWVVSVDTVPPHSADRAPMYFVSHFLNTTGGLAYYNWCVEVFIEGDLEHAHSNTECNPGTIPADASELKTQNFVTGCGNYQVRVIWIDSFNVRHTITKPDGSTAWGDFSVCP